MKLPTFTKPLRSLSPLADPNDALSRPPDPGVASANARNPTAAQPRAPESVHPFALAAAGRWHEAAGFWQRAGSPYERAAALAQCPQTSDLLEALTILNAIGAEPLAHQIRTRLKERGVARIPRGPVSTTRGNLAGLTQQQANVARLLVDDLTNAEIASRLVLSVRTVETYVAAILLKLNVRTRREAAIQLRALGHAAGS